MQVEIFRSQGASRWVRGFAAMCREPVTSHRVLQQDVGVVLGRCAPLRDAYTQLVARNSSHAARQPWSQASFLAPA